MISLVANSTPEVNAPRRPVVRGSWPRLSSLTTCEGGPEGRRRFDSGLNRRDRVESGSTFLPTWLTAQKATRRDS